MEDVIIVTGKDRLSQLVKKLRLKKILDGKKNVLIKVNLRAAAVKNYRNWAITNIESVKELSNHLLDMGLQVSIGEATPSRYMTRNAIQFSGIQNLKKNGIDIINLNYSKNRIVKAPWSKLKKIIIPEPVLKTDFLISVPVMKTHSITKITLTLKNMVGAINEVMMQRLHYCGIEQSIADINKVIKPDLGIIDATYAMEGLGPVYGDKVILNTCIGGFDLVSVDAVGARMMGFDPYEIKHIVLSEKRGCGTIKPRKIIGKLITRNFKKPDQTKFEIYNSKFLMYLFSKPAIHSLVYDTTYPFFKRIVDYINDPKRN